MDRANLKRAGLSCINFNLRKAARAVTAIYDNSLAPVGITSTQFSILIALAYYPKHSMSALSKFLVMDRTTLSKNLKPLLREKLIEPATSEDRRERLLKVSRKGLGVLDKAYPLWTAAQQKVSDILGEDQTYGLYRTLHKVSSQLSDSDLVLKN
jgi:DNA-binding MarR family transcriptional regulator